LPSDKKILISTVYKRNQNDFYDYFGANTRNSIFRFSTPRVNSFGLRFIKQNIPEIEILEYPTWDQYQKKINQEKWDVVGFSFYLNETHEILEMADHARKMNIPELWAGNYGALTESIQNNFDRIFIGYSCNEIAKELGKQVTEEDVIHHPIIGNTNFHGFKLNCHGYLFTNRGCNNRCGFCQTPVFCKKPSKISISSIENVLKYYKKLGLSEVIILDESFGLFKKHAEEVVDLLDKYGFYWFPMIRADYLNERLDDWSKKGLIGAMIGIENFDEKVLEYTGKNEGLDEILSCATSLKKKNKFTVGYYMIGFPDKTIDTTKQAIKKLASLKLDITQLCVVTPLPGTPLWRDIQEKYGIFDKDWHHFDAKHLVWNHPNITPKQMQDLLNKSFKIVYPLNRVFETSLGFVNRYIEDRGITGGMNYLIKHTIHANTFDYYPKIKRFLPNNGVIIV
jgi:MoaA/NifB/PqqE/SkfB family radical SAM enzyme